MSEGIIIKVDYGYVKYGDEDEPYIILNIKQTNNWECYQYFHKDKFKDLLDHFRVKKISELLHKTVELGEMPNSTMNPNKIRYTLNDDWLYNDNKRKTIKLKFNNKFKGCYDCKNLHLIESNGMWECKKHRKFIEGCEDYDY